jgi:predicted site-specific integrase-resolvase
VTRWARSGKLPSIRTIGGHRRYKMSDVRRLRDNGTDERN